MLTLKLTPSKNINIKLILFESVNEETLLKIKQNMNTLEYFMFN
jgi:hypothetical protein